MITSYRPKKKNNFYSYHHDTEETEEPDPAPAPAPAPATTPVVVSKLPPSIKKIKNRLKKGSGIMEL